MLTVGNFILGLISDIAATLVLKLRFRNLFPNEYTRFWNTLFANDLVIVTPAEEKEALTKSQVLDFQGLDELKQVFQHYYRDRYRQTSCDGVHRDMLRNNLLLIAGPVANRLTRHVLKPENEFVRYFFNDHVLTDKQNPEKKFVIELLEDGKYPSVDYGIISRFTNPFNSRKKVIISSGVFGWGTYAGLVLLSKKEILRYLFEQVGENQFQILVRVGVYRRVPEDPVLLPETLHIVERNYDVK